MVILSKDIRRNIILYDFTKVIKIWLDSMKLPLQSELFPECSGMLGLAPSLFQSNTIRRPSACAYAFYPAPSKWQPNGFPTRYMPETLLWQFHLKF